MCWAMFGFHCCWIASVPFFAHYAVKVISCYRRLWLTYFTGSMVTQLASPLLTLKHLRA